MDIDQEQARTRTREEWVRVVKDGSLDSIRPEEIFVACVSVDRHTDTRLVGDLMAGLVEIATRYLRRHVSASTANRGEDIIQATNGKLQDAILMPGHPDAAGYSIAFFAKLDLRLLDQIRRATKRASREYAIAVDEDGQELEFPDLATATAEQAMALDELLHDVDPRKRQALSLTAAGYPAYSDKPEEVSVSSMLNVSRKTAETWVREMKRLLLERIQE